MKFRVGSGDVLHPMEEMVEPAIFIKSGVRCSGLRLGFAFFQDGGLDFKVMTEDGLEDRVADLLPVGRGMKMITEFHALPCQLASQVQEVAANQARFHCDRADDKISAYIVAVSKCEIAGFVRENV